MIRKMEVKDTDSVYEIYNEAFFEPISKKNLIKDLEQNNFLSHYVKELDDKIVGFYICSYVLDQAEIFAIAVEDEYKNKGIGSSLLNHLIYQSNKRNIKQIRLEVSTKNIEAINLYTRFGFKITGVRKNYYQKIGEDAYNMVKEL